MNKSIAIAIALIASSGSVFAGVCGNYSEYDAFKSADRESAKHVQPMSENAWLELRDSMYWDAKIAQKNGRTEDCIQIMKDLSQIRATQSYHYMQARQRRQEINREKYQEYNQGRSRSPSPLFRGMFGQ